MSKNEETKEIQEIQDRLLEKRKELGIEDDETSVEIEWTECFIDCVEEDFDAEATTVIDSEMQQKMRDLLQIDVQSDLMKGLDEIPFTPDKPMISNIGDYYVWKRNVEEKIKDFDLLLKKHGKVWL